MQLNTGSGSTPELRGSLELSAWQPGDTPSHGRCWAVPSKGAFPLLHHFQSFAGGKALRSLLSPEAVAAPAVGSAWQRLYDLMCLWVPPALPQPSPSGSCIPSSPFLYSLETNVLMQRSREKRKANPSLYALVYLIRDMARGTSPETDLLLPASSRSSSQ